MLFDFFLLMLAAGVRRRSPIRNLVLDRTGGIVSGRELPAADMLTGTTGKVVGFTDVRDGTGIVSDSILAGLCWRFLSRLRGGIVLVRSSGLVDCHDMYLRFLIF